MSTVLAETLGAIRMLTLNRPGKLNAADLDMQRTLLRELETVAADRDLRALVITGAGRAFSAGGDRAILQEIIEGAATASAEPGRLQFNTMRVMLELEIPAIAAINGPAVGWGAGIAALCDMAVMGEGAFLSDPHVIHGIAAGPATQLLWPRRCSEAAARELLMTGRRVGAEEALRIGLCNHICPNGEERSAALEMAEAIAALPRAGIADTKRAFNASLIAATARMAAG